MSLPPLATAAQLAARLKITEPGESTPDGLAWAAALADASSTIRSAVGQPITAGTADLLLYADCDGRIRIYLSPMRVVSVSLQTGTPVSASDYRVTDGVLSTLLPFRPLVVAVEYGWAEIPDEIVKWTCILAAAQLANVAAGSLGITGQAPTSIKVDDAAVTYAADQSGASAGLPPRIAAQLRVAYGGPS